jgi:phosphoribosylaminoimidazolecarboxamide formyltransferase/IMP cyclohydrolase
LIANTKIDVATAIEINKLFYSSYCSWIRCRSNWNFTTKEKHSKRSRLTTKQVRSCLNGLLIQERNNITDNKEDLKTVTVTSPTEQEIQDLIFASKVCKKTQSLTHRCKKNANTVMMLFFLPRLCSNCKRGWYNGCYSTRRIDKDQLSIDYCNENKLAMVFTEHVILSINLFNFVGFYFNF